MSTSKSLDAVLVVDRSRMTEAELPAIQAAATSLTGVSRPRLISRYPAFGQQLQAAGFKTTSLPRVAIDINETAGRTIVPPAVDHALRLATVRDMNWQDVGPGAVAAAADVDQDAVNHMVSRIMGMADWQDLDLTAAGDPVSEFGRAQTQHRDLQNSLGWTPRERAIPDARRALKADTELRELVLGPVSGLVVWEAEELIEMDLSFLRALGAGVPTVGVYLEDGGLRRPYAETHSLRFALESEGTKFVHYDDLEPASDSRETPTVVRGDTPQADPSVELTDDPLGFLGGEQR